MMPRPIQYARRRSRMAKALEIAESPVPLWLALFLAVWAFGSCIQLVTARHELNQLRADIDRSLAAVLISG